MKKTITILLLSIFSYGNDFYKVVNIPSNDTLNVRIGAGIENQKIGELAYNATNIEVKKCQNASTGRKWCNIGYAVGNSKILGWVSAKYLEPMSSDFVEEEIPLVQHPNMTSTGNINFQEAWYFYYYAYEEEKAFELFKELADYGNVVAEAQVAKMYYLGNGVKQDKTKAKALFSTVFSSLTSKAMDGDAYAEYMLGYFYHHGLGTKKDMGSAMKWYKKAEAQENMVAMVNLGLMYEKGEGVKRDYSKAFNLYKKVANAGNFIAEFNLGNMYSEGKGVNQDNEKALYWYGRSAKKGFGRAEKEYDDLKKSMLGKDEKAGMEEDVSTSLEGVWVDNKNHLMWQNNSSNEKINQALSNYCNSLNLGGFTDWREPTVYELYHLSKQNLHVQCVRRLGKEIGKFK